MSASEMSDRIREFFDTNYRQMLAAGGVHVLTPRALEQARQQVEHYWKKLHEIATNVTETEVRLQLPNQLTPKGRKFVIEGVVDLVREQNQIRMYDVKTHFCGEVLRHRASYAAQLNVYAYVWRELRGNEVHEMGIIAVQLPERLREAIRDNDKDAVARELELWSPLVPLPLEPHALDETFAKIARTVDLIEDGSFSAPPASELAEKRGEDENVGGKPVAFATMHCRNCDGRFSCSSYREYAKTANLSGRHFDLIKYVQHAHQDYDLDDWIDGNIELDLVELFPDEGAPKRSKPSKPTAR